MKRRRRREEKEQEGEGKRESGLVYGGGEGIEVVSREKSVSQGIY